MTTLCIIILCAVLYVFMIVFTLGFTKKVYIHDKFNQILCCVFWPVIYLIMVLVVIFSLIRNTYRKVTFRRHLNGFLNKINLLKMVYNLGLKAFAPVDKFMTWINP